MEIIQVYRRYRTGPDRLTFLCRQPIRNVDAKRGLRIHNGLTVAGDKMDLGIGWVEGTETPVLSILGRKSEGVRRVRIQDGGLTIDGNPGNELEQLDIIVGSGEGRKRIGAYDLALQVNGIDLSAGPWD